MNNTATSQINSEMTSNEVHTLNQEPISIVAMSYEQLCEHYNKKTTSLSERKQINQLALWSEVEEVPASKKFGDFWPGDADQLLSVRKYRHPDCPKEPKYYYPDGEALMDTVLYLTGRRELSLGLYGDTGTGKSEMARYACSKLNIPLLQISLTPSSKEDRLMGTMALKDGETFFEEGVLPRAYDVDSVGYCLVIDEIDKGADSVIAKCHDVADFKPFTVDDNSTTYFPHPSFRLIVTGQTSGTGDSRGIYNVDKLDRAFCARIMWTRIQYPDREVANYVLRSAFPRLPSTLAGKMSSFYGLCTQALENVRLEEEGKPTHQLLDGKDLFQRLNTPVSMRLLKGWANEMIKFGSYRTVRQSYMRTIGHSAEEEDVRALELLLESVFADSLNEAPTILKDKRKSNDTNTSIESGNQGDNTDSSLSNESVEPSTNHSEETSTIEQEQYPESPAQDISKLQFGISVHDDGKVQKIWAIAADNRGTHTLYTHPITGQITYYHVPMSNFESVDNVVDYVKTKLKEKADKGYQSRGKISYDLSTGKMYQIN